MMLRWMEEEQEKERISGEILSSLPEWFGIPESVNEYIREGRKMPFLAYYEGSRAVGYLALKVTGVHTMEIYVMGVLKEFQGRGIGRMLIEEAQKYAVERGYTYLQVKTVESGHYPEYDRTNRFYQAMGFAELEVFPNLWDAWNPCQVYVKALHGGGGTGIRCTSKAILIRNQRILLNRLRRDDGSVYYDLPGGGQHKYETMEAALIREVREETGYEVRIVRLAAAAEIINTSEAIRRDFPDYAHRMFHIFLAELAGEVQREPSEKDYGMEGSEWIPVKEVETLAELHPAALKTKLPEILASEGAVYLGTEYMNW